MKTRVPGPAGSRAEHTVPRRDAPPGRLGTDRLWPGPFRAAEETHRAVWAEGKISIVGQITYTSFDSGVNLVNALDLARVTTFVPDVGRGSA